MFRYVLVGICCAIFAGQPLLAEDGGVTRTLDVPYGALPWQRLDIYRPETTTPETPIVVFFYGGGWSFGDKSTLRLEGESFAQEGVIFVAPNYRLGSDAVFPGFIEDAAAAVAYVFRTLAVETGETRPVVVGGWSAGAYNAAMVSLNQAYLADQGAYAERIRGVFGLSGPYEGGLCAGVRCPTVFPDPEASRWRVADFVDETDPPILLVHGGRDRYVPERHHQGVAAAARASGVSVEVLELPDMGHSVLPELLKKDSAVRRAVLDFVNAARTPG